MKSLKSELLDAALVSPLLSLLSQLPETLCWVKDIDLKTVWINPTVAYYVNLDTSDIIGKTDMDIYPYELAVNFEKDDLHVIQTGQSIVGKVELLVNHFCAIEWRKVTKLPIINNNQEVIGTTGISIPYDNADETLPAEYAAFTHIIQHAREHLHTRIGVRELAAYAHISESTLNRRFREILQLNPQQLLTHLRVAKACQLLQESFLTIKEIADRCGYDSPVAFTRAFKKQKHLTPKDFRSSKLSVK